MGVQTEREVWKEPVGVVGVIVPWNFPIEIILNKLGPVLAMGNTCVLKPAPDTPWNATRLGRLIAEHTDIPPGRRQHRALLRPPRRRGAHHVAATSTWSRSPAPPPPAGAIMAAAADTLKRVFLELGGKSVNLVLDDADLGRPMPGVVARVVLPRRPGLRHPDPDARARAPATTRPSSWPPSGSPA